MAKQFTVRDIVTGEVLATGTAKECGKALGMSDSPIYNMAKGIYTSRKYTVTEGLPGNTAEEKPKKENWSDWKQEAANKWEAFAAPLRRKYGIPVYKPKTEE